LVSTHACHRHVSASSAIATTPTASALSIVLCMVDTNEATVEPDDFSSQMFSDNEKLTRCCSCPRGRHRLLHWSKIAQIQSRDFDWYHDPSLLPVSCQYMWYPKSRFITASSTLPKRWKPSRRVSSVVCHARPLHSSTTLATACATSSSRYAPNEQFSHSLHKVFRSVTPESPALRCSEPTPRVSRYRGAVGILGRSRVATCMI
jgi:hypothetical protein